MQRIAKLILKLTGWKITQEFPDVDKAIILTAPHTCGQEFFLGLLYRWSRKLRIKFFMKKELFFFPLNKIVTALGAIRVERGRNRLVEQVSHKFKTADRLVVTIAPEGTRKKVKNWKRGFLLISQRANVPYVPCAIDFAKKEIKFGDPMWTSDDLDKDMIEVKKFFKDVTAKYPEHFTTGLEDNLETPKRLLE